MKIKYSAGDKAFRIICFIIMGSFRTTTAFSQKPFNFFDISLNAIKRNYTKAFTYKVGGHTPMPKMIFNSLIYVGGMVVLSVTIPAISGYITAKYDFKIKKLITSIAIITLVVPTIGSVTMTYRLMESLHLLNTFQGVFLMSAGGFGFSFLLFRNFFSAIPWEYAEAAFIDGASDFRVFITIMFPQATSILLSLGVMNFIGCWNDYYTPYLFLNDYPTVAYGLAAITSKYEASVPVVFAALSFSTIVMLVLYMMFSKTIMESMSAGGLKG